MTCRRGGIVAGALLVLAAFLGAAPVWAEFGPVEFDQWYYNAPTPPDARQAVEALNYFVHLTDTAATRLTSDKDYRLFIASRARFFAVQGEGQPTFWHHAESLFPQCFWSQKPLLLEIFKRTREPGVAESLDAWSHAEEDDDRRLILEEAGLSGTAPEAILEKPLASPQVMAEQWAVFFASGNTTVVAASLRFLKHNPARGTAGNSATGEPLMSAGAALREVVWDKLEQFSRVYPSVRQVWQAGILNEPLSSEDQKRALETLAWTDLEAGDTPAARALMPLAEAAWAGEPEKIDLFHGELAALSGQAGDVEAAARRLASVEPLWAERLAAFQARIRRVQVLAGRSWGEPVPGGEKVGRLGAQYLAGLKTCRTCDTLTVSPPLVSWHEKMERREQVKSLQLPSVFKGWQRVGATPSAWKIENGGLFLWTGRGRPWAEVHDPQVREQRQRGAALDFWVDLLNRQVPRETRENLDAPGGWVQLVYDCPGLGLNQIWGDSANLWPNAGQAGGQGGLRLTVELSKADGRVEAATAEMPDGNGRTWRLERIFFDQNFKP